MEIYRKFVLLLIIIVSTYIIYTLIQKRQTILNTKEEDIYDVYEKFTTKEGLTPNNSGNLIGNLIPPEQNFPLNQYCIMGSFNSAYTGSLNTISTDAIKHVLSIGCRVLDFEVYLVNGVAVVAVSTDPTYVTISSSNSMNLNDILKYVALTSMNSSTCSNYNDPLFVQFRVKSQNTDIYGLVAVAIANTLGLYNGALLYKGILNNLSPIDETVNGKYVIVMDNTINPNWAQYPICTSTTTHCNQLLPFINMVSGSDNLRSTPFNIILNSTTNNPHIFDDGLYTDVLNMQMATPLLKPYTANPPHSTFVINYGIQIVLYPFYIDDNNLTIYINMFNMNHSAFIPISTVIKYYKAQF